MLSVVREAEGYIPHQLAVPEQSDPCWLGQWDSLGRVWMCWEIEEKLCLSSCGMLRSLSSSRQAGEQQQCSLCAWGPAPAEQGSPVCAKPSRALCGPQLSCSHSHRSTWEVKLFRAGTQSSDATVLHAHLQA